VKPLKTDINKDYYPFGMQMPNRKGAISGGEYRYAFNRLIPNQTVKKECQCLRFVKIVKKGVR